MTSALSSEISNRVLKQTHRKVCRVHGQECTILVEYCPVKRVLETEAWCELVNSTVSGMGPEHDIFWLLVFVHSMLKKELEPQKLTVKIETLDPCEKVVVAKSFKSAKSNSTAGRKRKRDVDEREEEEDVVAE